DFSFADPVIPDRSDFDYDYETLRTTGVILAIIMFVSGILIALSKFPLIQRFHDIHRNNFTFVTNLSFLKQVKNSQNV
uniref:FXYD domain-containing ion transport regulator n=1 Tax=Mastacembelus armatus TaxID=205130 RepID=A0A3Q3MPZ9_9TELE